MPVQNLVNNIQLFNGRGEVQLTTTRFVSANAYNMAATTVDIYTCPAGKRAAVYRYSLMNNNASTATAQVKIKVSGVYYPIFSVYTMTTGTQSLNFSNPIILEPGESLSCTNSLTGINFNSIVMEFDSSIPFYTSKILNLASGNNTLYTCPVGRTAAILENKLSFFGPQVTSPTNIYTYNGSGGALGYSYYLVPVGQTVGTAYLYASPSIANLTATASTIQGGLNAGDFLVVNTSVATAGQFAWVNIMETR